MNAPFPSSSSLSDPPGAAPDGSSTQRARFAQATITRPQACALLAVLFICIVAFAAGPTWTKAQGRVTKDYELWYATLRSYVAGEDIYPAGNVEFPFMYPPSCALLLSALRFTGPLGFIIILHVVNGAAWLASILLSVYLATGRTLRRPVLLYALPSLITIVYLWDNFLLGQPMVLLLAILLGAFVCLRHRRWASAGVLFALAAAIKAFPVMAIGYLIYRRQWKATLAMVVTLVVLLLVLPAVVRGPARAWHDLDAWNRGMLFKYDANTIGQRPGRSYTFKNQSLAGVAHRLLRHVPAKGKNNDPLWYVNLADLSFRSVNTIILVIGLGICLLYIALMPRAPARTPESDAIELAMLLLLILVFSPSSFIYYDVWFLFPLTLLLAYALAAPAGSAQWRWTAGGVTLAVFLLALNLPFPDVPQAFGNALLANLLMFICLGWLLRDVSRRVSPLVMIGGAAAASHAPAADAAPAQAFPRGDVLTRGSHG